jgi:stress-induced morphogen
MSVTKEEITKILENNFPKSKIEVLDNHGTGDSYSISIESEKFKGILLVKQHKMVMTCLSEILKERLHAVSIKTSIPLN